MISPHEAQLVAAAAAGDELAFQRLLMLHLDRVTQAVARRIPADLRASLGAEDVCQEALVAAIRNRSSFQPRGEDSFSRWLMVIALRKLRDAVRSQRAHKRGGLAHAVALANDPALSSIVSLLDLVAVHERTPSRSVARHELVAAVQRAISGLKDEYRDVIQYRYLQGLSVAETAQRMQRSEGAVMKLCERGLKQLAASIGDPVGLLSRSG